MPKRVQNVAHRLPPRLGSWLERSHQRYHGELANRRERQEQATPNRPADGLPIPPRSMVRLVSGHEDVDLWLRSGKQDADLIRELVERHAGRMSGLGNILDLACGCGRVARWWGDLNGPGIFGCDYDGRLATWCQRNLPFITVKTNASRPPLPFASDTFDLVYSISLFTHLTEQAQDAWMRDIRRVLKPGGVLLFTVAGERFAGHLRDDPRIVFAMGGHVVVDPELNGEQGCQAFHPPAYVHDRLLPSVDLALLEAVYEDRSAEHLDSP